MKNSIHVLSRIASASNTRSEIPNQELAHEIVLAQDKKAINQLINGLRDKNKAIQNDCIKVLYEIGQNEPNLIVAHFNTFVEFLDTKNNRLQWGVMMALKTIAHLKPKETFDTLSLIIKTAENGSVITRDHAINIIISLAHTKKYSKDAFTLLMEQFLKSPATQFPMYAEKTLPIINNNNKTRFVNVLQERIPDLQKESQRKRVQKIIKRLR